MSAPHWFPVIDGSFIRAGHPRLLRPPSRYSFSPPSKLALPPRWVRCIPPLASKFKYCCKELLPPDPAVGEELRESVPNGAKSERVTKLSRTSPALLGVPSESYRNTDFCGQIDPQTFSKAVGTPTSATDPCQSRYMRYCFRSAITLVCSLVLIATYLF